MYQEPRQSRTRREWWRYGKVGSAAALAVALLGLLSARYSAVPAPGGGTQVEVSVTVPNGLLGQRHPARLKVSSGALGTGHVYGTDTGLTGERLTVRFRLAASWTGAAPGATRPSGPPGPDGPQGD
jgi:hypothetical protein